MDFYFFCTNEKKMPSYSAGFGQAENVCLILHFIVFFSLAYHYTLWTSALFLTRVFLMFTPVFVWADIVAAQHMQFIFGHGVSDFKKQRYYELWLLLHWAQQATKAPVTTKDTQRFNCIITIPFKQYQSVNICLDYFLKLKN